MKSQIANQDSIIQADIASRILVNAGPGTGKTYTVIQRIKKLLEYDFDGSILVLCFSRNAVQVIKERLSEELGDEAEELWEDGRCLIRTFDSFASYMLEDELDTSWSYNRRIEEFIQMLGRNPGELNELISYLIVDEIQDTVGVRARMLLAMLDDLSCGALLLGDQCQAIFDWTIRDTDDMPFSMLSEELKKRTNVQYELVNNHRQTKQLSQKEHELRDVLLNGDEAAQEKAVEQFKKWASERWKRYKFTGFTQLLEGSSDLILCKTNGEAAHVSQMLYDQASHVEHNMKQSNSHRTLAGWIAKVLCGNDGQILLREQFMNNADEYDVADPQEKWEALKSLDEHPNASGLHIREVLSALLKNDGLPELCINHHENRVIVSTVHRAKGSEAERVFWLDSPMVYENRKEQDGALSDAIKAAYVAATRAKSAIHMVEPDTKHYMKPVGENRWIQTGFGKNGKAFCKGIAMLPEDVDYTSFADAELCDEAQLFLSGLEAGFPVDLYPNEQMRCFEIYCEGILIGRTSQKFTADLFAGFDATNRNKNWPMAIKDVYISDVITIVSPGCADAGEPYQTAGCWLGVELGGFPVLQWY